MGGNLTGFKMEVVTGDRTLCLKLSSTSRLGEKRHVQEPAKTSEEFHPACTPWRRGRPNTQLACVRSILWFCRVRNYSKMQNFDALLNACFRRDCVLKGTRSTISISGIKKNGMKG